MLLGLVALASAAQAQAPDLIPAPFMSPRFVAPENAPSSIVIAGPNEPGERMVLTGRAIDGGKPVPRVSLYVFHTDANGLYTTDGTKLSRTRASMVLFEPMPTDAIDMKQSDRSVTVL
jgi:protocatechuate 3,4-dioxygenase beta subunit